MTFADTVILNAVRQYELEGATVWQVAKVSGFSFDFVAAMMTRVRKLGWVRNKRPYWFVTDAGAAAVEAWTEQRSRWTLKASKQPREFAWSVFGRAIRAIRENHDLQVSEWSRQLGVERKAMQRAESGIPVSVHWLLKICLELELDPLKYYVEMT